jgi:hypothetical protein
VNARVPAIPTSADSTIASTTTGTATPSSGDSVAAVSAESLGAVGAAGAVVDDLAGAWVVGVVDGAAVVGAAVVGGLVGGAASSFWPRPATAGGSGGTSEMARPQSRWS